jgi:hypothetical protein
MKTNRQLVQIYLLGAVLLLPAVVQAQFTFTTNNGAITITGYTGTSGNVIIPDIINGYPVTSIGEFYSYPGPTNITIPDSVTNIASGSFAYLSSLTAIMVDGQNAYYSSSNGILFDKHQTVLIQAPGGLAGSYAIPASVAEIGDNAFNYCGSLTNVTIGTNVTGIGANAFSSCTSLRGIAIPSSVTNIGIGAFAYCQSLTAITVDQQNLFYSSTNGILFDRPQATLIQAPGGIAGSPTIPDSVTSIGTGAFSDCTSLTGIMVPDSVTNIGSQAFYFCGSLTSFTLGTNVTSIGDDAFYYCSGLTSLTIPNRVTSIGNEAFEYCGGLTNVSIGAGVTTIGSDAFAFCSNLTGIAIPRSVTNIVFASSGMVRIGIGAQLINGPMEMVANCSRLTAITVDEQNLFYSSTNGMLFNKPQTTLLEAPGAFAGSYAIPGSVTSIGAEAFQNCGGLTSVAIPNSVTNIGNAAFAACGGLTAITVDGQNMFYRSVNGILFDKPQTTLIQFPGGIGGSYTVSNGIIRLGSAAFSGCSNLTRITVPTSVTNVGNATFANCSHAGIYFAGNAPGITSSGSGGILLFPPSPIFGNSFYNPNAEAVYYLPGTTGWGATFDGLPAYLWAPPYVCTPAGNSITINGFNGSGGAITIPDMINGLPVTTIDSGAFDNSGGLGLTNIVIGSHVTTIGSYAFAACTSLTSITIPNSVTNIGSYAFTFCDNLNSVYFQGNVPSADSSVFFHWSSFPFFPPFYEPPTPTTVYYLPGTTGWGTTFGGQPTVLWNPQAQTSGASFGVRANGFGFNITGTSNLIVVVEAATNLSSPDWQPVQTLTLTTGAAYFSDSQWTNYPGRFYRLRSP